MCKDGDFHGTSRVEMADFWLMCVLQQKHVQSFPPKYIPLRLFRGMDFYFFSGNISRHAFTTKKMSGFSATDKHLIKERDFKGKVRGFCACCQRSLFFYEAVCGHIVPKGRPWGGSNQPMNGKAICVHCNNAMEHRHMLAYCNAFFPGSASALLQQLKCSKKELRSIQVDEDWFNENPPLFVKRLLFVNLYPNQMKGKCASESCSVQLNLCQLSTAQLRWDQNPQHCVLFCQDCNEKIPPANDTCFISIGDSNSPSSDSDKTSPALGKLKDLLFIVLLFALGGLYYTLRYTSRESFGDQENF